MGVIGGFERHVTFGHFRCWSRFNGWQYRWRVQSRLAVKSMACMLTTPGMKWGNGVGAAAHEPPRGQEDKNMGCDGGLRRLYRQTVPPCRHRCQRRRNRERRRGTPAPRQRHRLLEANPAAPLSAIFTTLHALLRASGCYLRCGFGAWLREREKQPPQDLLDRAAQPWLLGGSRVAIGVFKVGEA